MAAIRSSLRLLLALIVACSANRSLRTRKVATAHGEESFAQTGRQASRMALKDFEDDDSGEEATAETADDIEASVEGSDEEYDYNAVNSFAQLHRATKKAATRKDDDDAEGDSEEATAETADDIEASVEGSDEEYDYNAVNSFAQVGRSKKQLATRKDDDAEGDSEEATAETADDIEASVEGADEEYDYNAVNSFAQVASSRKNAGARNVDDDDDEHDRAEDGTEDDDEPQVVIQGPRPGAAQDPASLMLKNSNTLLASAKAAAGEA